MSEYWYRAEDRRYANYDPFAEFEQPSGSHLVIELHRYPVHHHTPRGVWLLNYDHIFFVLGTATKQFAVPTIKLALQDLIARKVHHVWGATKRLESAEEHLEAAQRALNSFISGDTLIRPIRKTYKDDSDDLI